MTLSPFDDMMLAVVAAKVLVALLLLRWVDTSPKQIVNANFKRVFPRDAQRPGAHPVREPGNMAR